MPTGACGRRCFRAVPSGRRGTDQIAVKIQHKDRLLTDPGAIEDVLAVENDVVPIRSG